MLINKSLNKGIKFTFVTRLKHTTKQNDFIYNLLYLV